MQKREGHKRGVEMQKREGHKEGSRCRRGRGTKCRSGRGTKGVEMQKRGTKGGGDAEEGGAQKGVEMQGQREKGGRRLKGEWHTKGGGAALVTHSLT